MFELTIAFKYLIPRKKQLSVSLIALLSVAVISLVVWLVLLFLSVTEGIERNWLKKLTILNAPIRLTPTEHYYASYYYKIDALSHLSSYKTKSIGQKRYAPLSDPYNAQEDVELPFHFPLPDRTQEGSLKDPVKGVFSILATLQQQRPSLAFQEFELGGALLRLQLLRPGNASQEESQQSYVTQVTYLSTFPEKCPSLESVLLPFSTKDVNQALYLAGHATELSRQDAPTLSRKIAPEKRRERLREILQHIHVHALKTKYSLWHLPYSFLPQKRPLKATIVYANEHLHHVLIEDTGSARIWKEQDFLYVSHGTQERSPLSQATPLLVKGPLTFEVIDQNPSQNARLLAHTTLQDIPLCGEVDPYEMDIVQMHLSSPRPFLHVNAEKETGVFLAKSYQDLGVLVGDRGYLAYSSTTAASIQEHRLPIFVAGFYDPGILSIGNKCLLAPSSLLETINASSSSFNLDKTQSTGIWVWLDQLKDAEAVKAEIETHLQQAGIAPYWKVSTFKEYDFAKDLFQQFRSDKYLFTLLGIIILCVACCNIISLLVLLVNDKKKEIGMLQAMGVSRKRIACIFGSCGALIGIVSSLFGTCAAIATLHHLDAIICGLSRLQGQDTFNAAFFGTSLPHDLSHSALLFILVATPLLSLIAGCVPAIKACRLSPSALLRSE